MTAAHYLTRSHTPIYRITVPFTYLVSISASRSLRLEPVGIIFRCDWKYVLCSSLFKIKSSVCFDKMEDLCARLGFKFDRFYDDKAVKGNYFNYLSNRASRHRSDAASICVTHWDRETIEKTIKDILSNTSEYNRKYDVKQEDGVNVLVLKRPFRIRPAIYRKVMALEDSYDIVSKAHRLTGHKGYKNVFSMLRGEWCFPAEFNNALTAVCNVCQLVKEIEVERTEPIPDSPIKTSLFGGSSWRLTLINLQLKIPYIDHPKYILVFEEVESQFLILRALRDINVEEVTKQLINVFFGFGPPKAMTATDLDLIQIMDPALANIAKIYPPFKATIEYTDEAAVVTDKVIVDTLKDWINDAEVSEYVIDCEVGCYVVQKRLNSRLRLLPAKYDSAEFDSKHQVFLPHNRFYKNELPYEDMDLEVMVLGDISLRDLFDNVLPPSFLEEETTKTTRKRRLRSEKRSKKLKSK